MPPKKRARGIEKTRALIRAIYLNASATVRATDSTGKHELSEAFEVNRGVVQGDIVSPFCFILALQLIFLECDDRPNHGIVLKANTDRAVRVKAFRYADDIATISPGIVQTSERITAIAETPLNRGTLFSDRLPSTTTAYGTSTMYQRLKTFVG